MPGSLLLKYRKVYNMSNYKDLSVVQVQSIPNILIRECWLFWGFWAVVLAMVGVVFVRLPAAADVKIGSLGAITGPIVSLVKEINAVGILEDYPERFLSFGKAETELKNHVGDIVGRLRVVGGGAPMHNKLLGFGDLVPEWLNILNRHSDRFVIGSDSFFVSPNLRGSGPGVRFAQRNVPKLRATRHFLSLLPPSVARKIAQDNAVRIYGLK